MCTVRALLSKSKFEGEVVLSAPRSFWCALHKFFANDAGLVLSAGSEFDTSGQSDTFMRMNAACPRALVVWKPWTGCDRSAVGRLVD